MAIINTLPWTLVNGQIADANQVNANFAQIVSNVNANALGLAGGVMTGAIQGVAATARNQLPLLSQVQDGGANYGVDAGAVNAIAATLSPAIAAYAVGVAYWVKVGFTNTSAAALTLALNGLAVSPVTDLNGAAVPPSTVIANQIHGFVWNGTSFELLNPRTYLQGSNIASAATINLDTTNGADYVHITGVTTCTAITLAQGQQRTTVTDGSMLLTNGASLVLLGGQNIQTQAGDLQVWRGEAGGVVRMIDYSRAAGAFDAAYAAQCQLAVTSTTLLTLNRSNGKFLTINGINQVIPASGPTLSNGSTVASTLYYVYAFMSSGVMTLEASTTVYAVDSNSGMLIKTGDATRTLVGLAFTDGSNLFQTALVRSWFNDIGICGQGGGGSLTTTSTTLAVISGTQVTVLVLARDIVDFTAQCNGITLPIGAGQHVRSRMSTGVDGASPQVTPQVVGANNDTAGVQLVGNTSSRFCGRLSEGSHTLSAMGCSDDGNSMTITSAYVTYSIAS